MTAIVNVKPAEMRQLMHLVPQKKGMFVAQSEVEEQAWLLG